MRLTRREAIAGGGLVMLMGMPAFAEAAYPRWPRCRSR
jgi:hypothetical protein